MSTEAWNYENVNGPRCARKPYSSKTSVPDLPPNITILHSSLGSRDDEGGYDCPAARPHLESEDDSSGWLRSVRPVVGVQGGKPEVGTLVHEPSVFGA